MLGFILSFLMSLFSTIGFGERQAQYTPRSDCYLLIWQEMPSEHWPDDMKVVERKIPCDTLI